MNAKSSIGPAWFWIAVQALVVIAEGDGACPSGTIANNLKAHAVFLRRVMAQLVRVGIIEAHEGRDGGYQLIRSAEQFSYLRSTRLQETLTRLKSTRVFMARMPDSYNPEKGKARD